MVISDRVCNLVTGYVISLSREDLCPKTGSPAQCYTPHHSVCRGNQAPCRAASTDLMLSTCRRASHFVPAADKGRWSPARLPSGRSRVPFGCCVVGAGHCCRVGAETATGAGPLIGKLKGPGRSITSARVLGTRFPLRNLLLGEGSGFYLYYQTALLWVMRHQTEPALARCISRFF